MNILNEDATTNLCSNPSAETGTANITKVNGTGTSSVTPANEQVWSGNYSFKFEVTSGTIEAYRVGVMPPAVTGQTFTSSAWMFIQSGAFRVRVAFRDSGGNVIGGQSGVYTSATAGWVRLSATATAPANTATVEIIIGANNPGIAYIDALQLEEKPGATSYADGSLGFGYAWTGTPHNSSSTRAAGVLAADGSITARDINSFGSVTATGAVKPGSFTRSRLPASGVEGRIINLLDGQRALYRDNGTQWYPLNRGVIDVRDFGARLDARALLNISATTGSTTLTAPTGTFAPTDVGKTIIVYGAGASASNLVTTITAYTDPQTVTVANAAGQGLTGAYAIYGTDDTAAFQAAIDATSTPGKRGLFANEVVFTSAAIISDTLLIKDKSMSFAGVGWGALMHDDNTPNSNPGSSLIWAGVAGKSMIHLLDSLNSRLSDFRLFGNSSAKPIGIHAELSGTANHGSNYSTIERVYIGRMYVAGEPDGARTFSTAIYGSTPVGNTDFYRLNTILIRGAEVGYDSNNINITYWDWQTLLVLECGVGFKVVGDVHGRDWFFSSNDLDLQIGESSALGGEGRLVLDHFGSESSVQMMTWESSGFVTIGKGSFQTFANAIPTGILIDARGPLKKTLMLTDFQFTSSVGPNGTPVGYVSKIAVGVPGGTPGQQVYLKNVHGIGAANILVEGGPVNEGRGSMMIEIDETPNATGQHTAHGKIYYRSNDTEAPFNRTDFLGKVNAIGGEITAKRLPTTPWYGFPVGVAPTGTGATSYTYRVSAVAGSGESLGTVAPTTTNAATLSSSNYNTVGWHKVDGADAYRVYRNGFLLVTLKAYDLSPSGDSTLSFKDDGTYTPSTPLPSADTTGRVVGEGALVSLRSTEHGLNTVSFSATPSFNAALGDTQRIVLTGNVTASTIINPPVAGRTQRLTLIIEQDGTGGRSFVFATNVKGAMAIGVGANAASVQTFVYDGTNWRAETPGVIS